MTDRPVFIITKRTLIEAAYEMGEPWDSPRVWRVVAVAARAAGYEVKEKA